MKTFSEEVEQRVRSNFENKSLQDSAMRFMQLSAVAKYSYNFYWQGRPIIQYPQDIVAMQELIWQVKPDLILEMGVAHGGSALFYASMLCLLDIADAVSARSTYNPMESRRKVIAVDVDIRQHNQKAIDAHPMRPWCEFIEDSSVSGSVITRVSRLASEYDCVMVCLDSNHTHQHVLSELNAYAPLVTTGSYCVVFDTIIEHLSEDSYPDRPWGPGNSPKSAIDAYLAQTDKFEVDREIEGKLLLTVSPGGFLRKVR